MTSTPSSVSPITSGHRDVGPVRVAYHRIIGTDVVVFRAWERVAGVACGHTTITSYPEGDGWKWWGAVSARPLPEEVERMPYDGDRATAARAFRVGTFRESERLVLFAFPALAGLAKDGEVVATVAEAVAAVSAPVLDLPRGGAPALSSAADVRELAGAVDLRGAGSSSVFILRRGVVTQ